MSKTSLTGGNDGGDDDDVDHDHDDDDDDVDDDDDDDYVISRQLSLAGGSRHNNMPSPY